MTIAGNGCPGFADGRGHAAAFFFPLNAAFDSKDNLIVRRSCFPVSMRADEYLMVMRWREWCRSQIVITAYAML